VGSQTVNIHYVGDRPNRRNMSEKTFRNVVVDEKTYAGLKRLKFNTGGRSYTNLISQMIEISEQRILEEAREIACVINTQK
jgi:hypothetical protein